MEAKCGSDAEIYARYAPELVRFARGLVGPDDAPDVVAEAVTQLMYSPVWPKARNHRALLYRAVLYQAQSWQRSKHRRAARESTSVPPGAWEVPDFDPAVGAAIAALSPQQRAVTFLTYWEDLTPSTIAVLLDVSEGSVRKQLARARRRLRKVLE